MVADQSKVEPFDEMVRALNLIDYKAEELRRASRGVGWSEVRHGWSNRPVEFSVEKEAMIERRAAFEALKHITESLRRAGTQSNALEGLLHALGNLSLGVTLPMLKAETEINQTPATLEISRGQILAILDTRIRVSGISRAAANTWASEIINNDAARSIAFKQVSPDKLRNWASSGNKNGLRAESRAKINVELGKLSEDILNEEWLSQAIRSCIRSHPTASERKYERKGTS